MKIVNIFDVARYILSQKETVSVWKLQKLCFYSQAWEIAWTGEPLFAEDFEAWSNGPVCPVLAKTLDRKYSITETDIAEGNAEKLSADQKETIEIVLRTYGDMDPFQLKGLSCKETPWRTARGKTPDGEPCQNVITKESIGAYYKTVN